MEISSKADKLFLDEPGKNILSAIIIQQSRGSLWACRVESIMRFIALDLQTMAALQKVFARCPRARSVFGACPRTQRLAAFSSSSSNPVFELKTCKVPQSKRRSFLQESEQHLPRKTTLAKMHGFWISESWEDDAGEGFSASLWEYGQ